MAWIKMSVELTTHPKVMQLAALLRSEKHRVIGGLLHVWSIFDAHTEDGILNGYTPEFLDKTIGWRGFSRAMISIGWLSHINPNCLSIKDYEEHNGTSAKRRAQDASRKAAASRSSKNPHKLQEVSASDAESLRIREDKRKEEQIREIDHPLPPEGEADEPSLALSQARGRPKDEPSPDFLLFWDAYPRKEAKPKAWKAWKKAPLPAMEVILTAVRRQRESAQWKKEEGQFIPMPATWISNNRWEDKVEVSTRRPNKYANAF
jgi:hypothetical protein